jgi:hypothetical protein
MRRLLSILVVSFGLFSLQSLALTDAEIRAKIDNVISVRHQAEGEEWWRALGPRTPIIAIAMYSESKRAVVKSRLIYALGFFPESSEAVAFLEGLAKTEKNKSFRRAAIRSYGLSQGSNGLVLLEEILEDPNPRIRSAAAEVMAEMNVPEVDTKLDAYLEKEKASWIRAKVAARRSNRQAAKKMSVESWLQPRGKWQGVWVHADAQGRLRSKELQVTISIESKTTKALRFKATPIDSNGKPGKPLESSIAYSKAKWSGALALAPNQPAKKARVVFSRQNYKKVGTFEGIWPESGGRIILKRMK